MMDGRRAHCLCAATFAALLTSITSGRATVILQAATANPDTKPEVRLRWTVSGSDWLPDGGFNLYRIEKNVSKKLNNAPLKPIDPSAHPTIALATRGAAAARDFKYNEVFSRANTRPAASPGALTIFQEKAPRPPSSSAVFDALAATMKAINETRAPGATPQEAEARSGMTPALNQYFSQIRSTPLPLHTPVAISQVDLVRKARADLMIHAILHPEVSKALGLSFDDTAVENGDHFQYALKAINNGQESPDNVASIEITVGADPQPPAPESFKALERDADTVELRWDRLPEEAENRFGLVSYNILRTDPGQANGVRVNKIPIVIASLEANGKYTEPVSFFRDHPVPVGTVSYQVVLVDMFGRQSRPTSLSFDMKEWHAPQAPEHIHATYENGKTTVLWTPSQADPASLPLVDAGKPIRYHIYRVDVENSPAKFDLLSTEPYDGVFAPARSQSLKALLTLIPEAHSVYLAAISGTATPDHKALFGKAARPTSGFDEKMSVDKFIQSAPAVSGMGAMAIKVRELADAGFLSFIDTMPPKDHYYRYLVTAQYPSSLKESGPAITPRIPIPLDTPPAAPGGLTATFGAPQRTAATEVDIKGRGGHGISVSAMSARAGVDVWSKASEVRSAIYSRLRHPSGPGSPPDIGGTLALRWNPVQETKPVIYRIYRANATHYFNPSRLMSSVPPLSTGASDAEHIVQSPGDRVAPKSDKIQFNLPQQNNKSAGETKQAESLHISHAPVNLSALAGTRSRAPIDDHAYSLLGQVTDDNGSSGPMLFEDDLPRSLAHYYQYRVVPVNRWGYDGAPTELMVRIPATMPPTTPMLKDVRANLKGNVEIVATPNAPGEEVAKYHVFRKKLLINVETLSTGSTSTTSAVAGGASIGGTASTGDSGLKSDRNVTRSGGGTGFVRIVEPARIEVKFGSSTLGAHGPNHEIVGAGASRFGITRHSSASALLAEGLAAAKLTPELQSLLADTGWDEIGTLSTVINSSVNSAAPAAVAMEDTRAEPQIEYLYRITAENSDGLVSFPSSPLDATPFRVKADPPGALSLTPGTDPAHKSAVALSWGPSPAGGLLGYVVKRSSKGASATSLDGPLIQLSGILAHGTTFTDYSAFPGQTYSYQVLAIDNSGNMSDPSVASITR